MRSITIKLILAFVGVSLISVALIAVSARWRINREFSSFVFDQNSSDLVTSLTSYYLAQGSWDQVNTQFIHFTASTGVLIPPDSHGSVPQLFTLADSSRMVVVAGPGYQFGEIIPRSEISAGTPIIVEGSTVGVLLVGQDAFGPRPMEQQFLQRTSNWLLYSALGAAAVALVLGILLAYNLTRPIHELIKATQAISLGALGKQVTVRSKDEMGKLASAFNKMSADLARSNQARRQMTADIAHELRTPLSLIIAQTEAVQDGILHASRKNFDVIHEEADRLEHMVEDLRLLSLADAGELSINLQPVPVEKLLLELSGMYKARIRNAKIILETTSTPGLPDILVDPGRMIQVLTNILDNALRHTPERGKITLEVRQAGKFVEIAVRDTGSGVAEDDLERIFDRLYRADTSRQRDEGGSGLGLAIAKSIIEMHQGKIWAESRLGEGLTIHIFIPSAQK